jgi:hypothetical protein
MVALSVWPHAGGEGASLAWKTPEVIATGALVVSAISTTVAVLVFRRSRRAEEPVAWVRSSRVLNEKYWWYAQISIQNNSSFPLQLNRVTIVSPPEAKFLDWDHHDGHSKGYELPKELQLRPFIDTIEFGPGAIAPQDTGRVDRYVLGYKPQRVKFLVEVTLLSPKPRTKKLKFEADLSQSEGLIR